MHQIRKELLWENKQKNAPLIFLVPGGSGSCGANMRGFAATAGFFWLNGYNSYIAETAGQDGHSGLFSIQRCLVECRDVLAALKDQISPSKVFLFGSCSGGTIVTYLASESQADAIILWEALPYFPNKVRLEFARRAKEKVNLAPTFLDEYLETADKAAEVTCPVASFYGSGSAEVVFSTQDAAILRKSFSSTPVFIEKEIPGADHNLTRGSDSALLIQLLQQAIAFLSGTTNTQ